MVAVFIQTVNLTQRIVVLVSSILVQLVEIFYGGKISAVTIPSMLTPLECAAEESRLVIKR
jgi:hypothetical protein